MRSLCIITHGYPCRARPISFPFAQEFAHAVARQGVKVKVVAPLPVHRAWRARDPLRETESLGEGNHVEVFRPRYLSVSDRQVLRWNTVQIGLQSFCMAVRSVLRRQMTFRPDALYGHFLYLGGAAAARLGLEMGIPAFVMVGDGKLNSAERFGPHRVRRHFSAGVAGFLPNSSDLASLLVEKLDVNPERIGVFPNGVNHSVFFPRDKKTMRDELGLPQDQFLVITVGYQDLQKGAVRVGEAIQGLRGVSGIFLGSGPNPPTVGNAVFNGVIPHSGVPEWLSAADLFVLPSTYEGSCNAILEAMACGLPVIASQGEFNDDILNDEVAIRVDPLDVAAIRSGIVTLRDDSERRRRMASRALEWAESFDVNVRVRRMLEFMCARIGCGE